MYYSTNDIRIMKSMYMHVITDRDPLSVLKDGRRQSSTERVL